MDLQENTLKLAEKDRQMNKLKNPYYLIFYIGFAIALSGGVCMAVGGIRDGSRSRLCRIGEMVTIVGIGIYSLLPAIVLAYLLYERCWIAVGRFLRIPPPKVSAEQAACLAYAEARRREAQRGFVDVREGLRTWIVKVDRDTKNGPVVIIDKNTGEVLKWIHRRPHTHIEATNAEGAHHDDPS
jgi:hypothetical protein